MLKYGEAMKAARKQNGYSQSKVAKETGIVQPNLSAWEKEKYAPNIEFCAILADFYGISIDELVGHDSLEKPITNKKK